MDASVTAMVRCLTFGVEGEQRAVIHAIHVIARQHQHQRRVVVGDKTQVLEHGVGRFAGLPIDVRAVSIGMQHPDAAGKSSIQVPRAANADMGVEGVREVLGQDHDVEQPGIGTAVGQRKVDDAEYCRRTARRLDPASSAPPVACHRRRP